VSSEKIGASYARRSSEKQDDVSLKTQSIKNLEYAAKNGIAIPGEYVFEEDNFTGKVADRPILNQIFKLANEGKIQCITVYLVDRWARDVGAGAELINRIFTLGIELHFVSWGTSVRNTPMDYARYNMEILFSDVERRTIVNRFYEGKVNKAQRGYIVGAGRNVRYGFKRVERMTENGRIKDLERNFDQTYDHEQLSSPAQVTRWIFEHIAEKRGVTTVCDLLNDTYHIPRPSGGIWDDSCIYRMIRASEYYGQFYYGKTNGRKSKPVEERIIIIRPDLALVELELWDQANAVLDEGKGKTATYEYLFSRRVRCMRDHKMVCQPSHDRHKETVTRFYYKCKVNKFIKKKCDMPHFRSTVVDNVVFKWVEELLADPEAKLRGLQKAQQVAVENSSDLMEKITACDTTIAREERELDHLYADRKQYRDNPRMLARIEQDIAETSERIERVRRNRAEYQQKISQQLMSDDEVAYRISEIERINTILKRFGTLSFRHRRRLIELLNITIVLGVDNGRQYVEILWYGDSEKRWLYDEEEAHQLDSLTSG
jgi:site-specific DNA recombinase